MVGLLGRQVALVLQPQIARSLEFGTALALGASNLVDGLADQLHDVELVEGDLGPGEVFADALDEGGAHVDAHLVDLLGRPCGF